MKRSKPHQHRVHIETVPTEILFHIFEYVGDATTLYYTLPYVCKSFSSTLNQKYTDETSGNKSLDKVTCINENLLWKNMSPQFFSHFKHDYLCSFKKLYFIKYGVRKHPYIHTGAIQNLYNRASMDLEVLKKGLLNASKNESISDVYEYQQLYEQTLELVRDVIKEEEKPEPTTEEHLRGYVVYYFFSKYECKHTMYDDTVDAKNKLCVMSTSNGNSIIFDVQGTADHCSTESYLKIWATLHSVIGARKTIFMCRTGDVDEILNHLGCDIDKDVWDEMYILMLNDADDVFSEVQLFYK